MHNFSPIHHRIAKIVILVLVPYFHHLELPQSVASAASPAPQVQYVRSVIQQTDINCLEVLVIVSLIT